MRVPSCSRPAAPAAICFPAQALAGELAARGREIVVMTDARFANYATSFPGARIETVPSAPLNAIDRAVQDRGRRRHRASPSCCG